MARPNKRRPDRTTVLFDVMYEDGTRTSNRRVPGSEVDTHEGEDRVRAFLEAQDRKITEVSGTSRGRIKSLARSPGT